MLVYHKGVQTACLVALIAALISTACSQPASPSLESPVAPAIAGAQNVIQGSLDRTAEGNFFELCKDYSGGVGPTVTFNVSVDQDNNGSTDSNFTVQLSDGQCEDIWTDVGIGRDIVTVSEQVPAGYTASYVKTILEGGSPNTTGPISSNTATGPVAHADVGSLVIFTNTKQPTSGSQGCTPGYWKQEHHLDSWKVYQPTDDFDATFGVNFFNPNISLLTALQLNGGGLNRLASQGVAALLNAATGSGVNYQFTTAQVIAIVQGSGAYAGLTVEQRKDLLDAANNGIGGCPLN